MKIYERRVDESEKAFAALKVYLEMGSDRSLPKVARKCSKSISLINRWSRQNDWQNRARAWDNEILTAQKQEYTRRFSTFLDKQFGGNEEIQRRALKVLSEKDMNKISWKSWNEIYRSNFAEMLEISKHLGIAADADNDITIHITSDLEGNDNVDG